MTVKSEHTVEKAAPAGRAIEVLFVAGTGRSGSTLLDRLIGRTDGFVSAGELRFIWTRGFREGQLCGCGSPFWDCEFWRAVSLEAFGVVPADFDAEGAISLMRTVDRIRYTPWLVSGRSSDGYDRRLRAYGELLAKLYRAMQQVSGARVIVDSSKDPTHAMLLSRTPGFVITVVHLVRDPRAVAFSWMRRKWRPEIHWEHRDMPIESPLTTAWRWNLHNVSAELLGASSAEYVRLRYEDAMATPSEAMARVLGAYVWAEPQAWVTSGAEVSLEPSHSVSGNPMRFQTGHVSLQLDDEWRTAMGRRDRVVVSAMTLPLLRRYGYRLRSAA